MIKSGFKTVYFIVKKKITCHSNKNSIIVLVIVLFDTITMNICIKVFIEKNKDVGMKFTEQMLLKNMHNAAQLSKPFIWMQRLWTLPYMSILL